MHPTTQNEILLALTVFFGTFAFEDGATLLAAGLAASGRLDAPLGIASAFLGIWVGDMGLYAAGLGVGRRAGRSQWLCKFVPQARIDQAQTWFSKKGAFALVASRFVPGSRLPIYTAAGTLAFPFRIFALITGLGAAAWVVGIFMFSHFLSGFSHAATKLLWIAIPVLAVAPRLLKAATAFFARVQLLWRKYRRWEFWPAWLFYPPVAAMCAWLAIKHRGISLPTVANPCFRNGGIVGESKIEILSTLMQTSPDFTAEAYVIPGGALDGRTQTLNELVSRHAIPYPFVLKPNIGQRGAGFKLISSAHEAELYLQQVTSEIVLQRYISTEKEAGIFYYRFPHEDRGHIFAITRKRFPEIVGDGIHTFAQLIQKDERASLIADTYLARFPEWRDKRPAKGQRIRLVEAGNHCQGSIFRDGQDLVSEELCTRMDQISLALPGFFIGRYDIRYSSDSDLRAGINFQIIELNGAASEATNIYDAKNSLQSAYKTLYHQWELVYAIGSENRGLGHQSVTPWAVLKDWRHYQKLSAAYPAAD